MNLETQPTPNLQMLKLKREFWDPVMSGAKCFEVRKNDRDFKVGQTVMFRDPESDEVMEAQFIITYVLSGWGIKDGHVVFGMHSLELPPMPERVESFKIMSAEEAGKVIADDK